MSKHEEALERAKKEYQEADGISREILERIFPELSESEDEKIRKAIVRTVESFGPKSANPKMFNDMLAWLEKQRPIFSDSEQRDPWEYIEKFKKLYGHYPKDADEISVIVSEMVKKQKPPIKLAKGSDEDLTDFESALYSVFSDIWQDYTLGNEINVAEVVKEHSGELLEVARNRKWGEEDDTIISRILCICNDFKKSFEISPASAKVVQKDIDKIDNWLKSLNPLSRWRWKPSEEQMKALDIAIRAGINPSTWEGTALRSLYDDLKKL